MDLDEAAAVFTSVRPRLFGIAYRMLSSVAEAEDLVQDAWLRWQTTDRGCPSRSTPALTPSRARKHMASDKRRRAGAAAQKELLTAFVAAARSGDLAALEKLFAADVASLSDGDGTFANFGTSGKRPGRS